MLTGSRLRKSQTLLLRSKRLVTQKWRQKSSVPSTATNKLVEGSTISTSSSSSSWFGRAWESYTGALMARPLTVKATAASIIFFCSDSATQKLLEPDSEWNAARAGSGAVFGVVATGWLHYWWGFLEAAVGKRLPVAQHRLSNTLAKVFLDQAIGAPLYIYTYYVITHFLKEWNHITKVKPEEGKSKKPAAELLDETTNRASDMLLPTMLRHWTVWPAVHSFNFYYCPLHHRVLVQNLVLVGWSGYLSHLNNGGLMTPEEEIEVTDHILHDPKLRPKKTISSHLETKISRRNSDVPLATSPALATCKASNEP